MCHVGNHRIIAVTFRKGAFPCPPRCNAKKPPGYWALMSQRLGVWRVQGQRISIFGGISFQHLSESGSSSIRIAKLQRRVPEMRNWVIAEWLASIICILFLDVENDLVVKNWLLCIFSCELNFGVGVFLFMVAWRCILPRDWHESCLCPPIMLKWSTRVSTGVTWLGTTLDPGWI